MTLPAESVVRDVLPRWSESIYSTLMDAGIAYFRIAILDAPAR